MDKIKTEYFVVFADSDEIDAAVTEMLDEGWELQGGVSVQSSDGDWFAQAVVRRVPETSEPS